MVPLHSIVVRSRINVVFLLRTGAARGLEAGFLGVQRTWPLQPLAMVRRTAGDVVLARSCCFLRLLPPLFLCRSWFAVSL